MWERSENHSFSKRRWSLIKNDQCQFLQVHRDRGMVLQWFFSGWVFKGCGMSLLVKQWNAFAPPLPAIQGLSLCKVCAESCLQWSWSSFKVLDSCQSQPWAGGLILYLPCLHPTVSICLEWRQFGCRPNLYVATVDSENFTNKTHLEIHVQILGQQAIWKL